MQEMTTKMEGIMGDKKGTLIKYNEVLKKLNIPNKYLIHNIWTKDVFVIVNPITIEKLKFGEIIPDEIRTVRTEHSTIKLAKDDFKKKLGLKYEHFGVEMVFKEETTFLEIWGYEEELQYFLDNDPERTWFWIYEEDGNQWRRKLFVELPPADKVRK